MAKHVEAEFRAHGVVHFFKTVSNCGGILLAMRGDQVAYCDCFNGREEYCSRWQDLKVDNKDRMFFYWHSRKMYTEDFMRVNL